MHQRQLYDVAERCTDGIVFARAEVCDHGVGVVTFRGFDDETLFGEIAFFGGDEGRVVAGPVVVAES